MKIEEEDFKLKGKLIMAGFSLFTIGTILEISLPLNLITLIITWIILALMILTLNGGLPEWMREFSVKERLLLISLTVFLLYFYFIIYLIHNGSEIGLPFEIGFDIKTLALMFNIGIPIVYFVNFFFMLSKLGKLDKDAPFYPFIKSLVWFFLFYGIGALYFVWYDFFYMEFKCPNPIDIWFGAAPSPPDITMQLWKIGNIFQGIGLLLMLIQLRKVIFKKKFYQRLPVGWVSLGLSVFILDFFIPLPLFSDVPFFWLENAFLFTFMWSISLPLTYSFIWKNTAGDIRRYAFMLFFCFILFGISWGLRSRMAVHLLYVLFEWLPLIGSINFFTYEFLWFLRGFSIVTNLIMVLIAYQMLLKGLSITVIKETPEAIIKLIPTKEIRPKLSKMSLIETLYRTRPLEEEVSFYQEKKICLVCKGKLSRLNYICPECNVSYCLKCYQVLNEQENLCWVCSIPFDETKPSKPYEEELEEESATDEGVAEVVKKPKKKPKKKRVRLFFVNNLENVPEESPKTETLGSVLKFLENLPTKEENADAFLGLFNDNNDKIRLIRFEKDNWTLNFATFEENEFSTSYEQENLATDKVKEFIRSFIFKKDSNLNPVS